MTVRIHLIGKTEPVHWRDEEPARPSYRTYSYLVLSSGALRVDVTVQHVDDQGYLSTNGTATETVYGPHAWQQVEGSGEAVT
ncbi:hypothetical protein AB0912_15625 [Streptomyces sp. NPDC007084]|uniref:hypothetical protein n=1 Tax=Streptomyces sp. NPDC007084 TaxID=3154313 RepID=UPI003454C6F3